MKTTSIHISQDDRTRIQLLITALSGDPRASRLIARLRDEVSRAVVVPFLPANVVGLNSTALVRDLESGDLDEFTLTLPERADANDGRLSLLAPLGTAILGFAEGDEFTWEMPGGIRRLRIERVTQPAEATASVNT